MEGTRKLFLSEKIILEDRFFDGGVLVGGDGKIIKILDRDCIRSSFLNEKEEISHFLSDFDYGSNVLMPGIIDTHVHVNEPGRADWEGFETATKAAASGGITTIADMPLNSIPPTTSLENLKTKVESAKDKVFVDVAFWGGVVPGNENELLGMIKAGVVGFKCFLTPSGVDEFEYVRMEDVESAAKVLENTETTLAFHAEMKEDIAAVGDPTRYETFLKTRPSYIEEKAIDEIINLSKNYNLKMHIVHLSTATALESLRRAKLTNKNLTVETCHHYLTLNSEDIPDRATEFKCCPPIRDKENRENLWKLGLANDIIDMVVSDHSPSTPELQLLKVNENGGNFLKAWGGISSLQFGLPLFWTESRNRGFTIFDINKYMTRNTSKLVGLHNRKGKIQENFDADFVVWDPEATVTITEDRIWHKIKVTPYMGLTLKGKVYATILRGEVVYENCRFSQKPMGRLLVNEEVLM